MENKILLDRITGQELEELPEGEVVKLGRYILRPCAESPVLLNGFPQQESIHLVPNRKGHITLRYGAQSQEAICKSPLLDKAQGETIRDIAEEGGLAESWGDWQGILPLIRDIRERLKLDDFEQHLDKWIHHLEAIVRDPAAKLTRISEKMPVSRVKRYRNRALDHLAQHSEDWLKRSYQSVVPRSILAERIDQTIDIYENQVTGILIEKALQYLSHRIDVELPRLLNFRDTLEKVLQQGGKGEEVFYYKKVERNYELAGAAYPKDKKKKQSQTKDARSVLEKCRRRLLRLRGAAFFTSVNTRKNIERKLKMTNRFESHQHYQFVARLWKKYNERHQNSSGEEIQMELAERVESYNGFVLTLIIRALDLLDYTPVDPVAFGNSSTGQWGFSHSLFGDASLQILQPSAVYRLKTAAGDLYFHPLADTLSRAEAETLIHRLPSDGKKRLLVYLFEPFQINEPQEEYPPLTREESGPLGFLPVSPQDLDGSERIARVVWQHLCAWHLQKFPTRLPKSFHRKLISIQEDGIDFFEDLIKQEEKSSWIQGPIPDSVSQTFLKAIPRMLDHRKVLNPKIREVEKRELISFLNKFQALSDDSQKITQCVNCGKTDSTTVLYQEAASFRVKCENCSLTYGRRDAKVFVEPANWGEARENLSEKSHAEGDWLLDSWFGKEAWGTM